MGGIVDNLASDYNIWWSRAPQVLCSTLDFICSALGRLALGHTVLVAGERLEHPHLQHHIVNLLLHSVSSEVPKRQACFHTP